MESTMNIQEQEERDYTHSSAAEVDEFDAQLHAYNSGNTTSAWILSNRDVWYRNPYYIGLPEPHPEMGDD